MHSYDNFAYIEDFFFGIDTMKIYNLIGIIFWYTQKLINVPLLLTSSKIYPTFLVGKSKFGCWRKVLCDIKVCDIHTHKQTLYIKSQVH